jgi:hypothetical protein
MGLNWICSLLAVYHPTPKFGVYLLIYALSIHPPNAQIWCVLANVLSILKVWRAWIDLLDTNVHAFNSLSIYHSPTQRALNSPTQCQLNLLFNCCIPPNHALSVLSIYHSPTQRAFNGLTYLNWICYLLAVYHPTPKFVVYWLMYALSICHWLYIIHPPIAV